MSMNDYEKQAADFLEKTGTTLEVRYLRTGPYFDGETDVRDIYEVTLKREGRQTYQFTFGQYVARSGLWALWGGRSVIRYSIEPQEPRVMFPCSRRIAGEWFKQPRVAPTPYDVLACMEAQLMSFSEFCDEFGYDVDSRKALATWERCMDQAASLRAMFTESELAELAEIQ